MRCRISARRGRCPFTDAPVQQGALAVSVCSYFSTFSSARRLLLLFGQKKGSSDGANNLAGSKQSDPAPGVCTREAILAGYVPSLFERFLKMGNR